MNLDLNLGPVVQPPQDEHPNNISFGEWLHGSMREEVSNPPTASHQLPPVWRHIPVPMEAGNIPLGLTAGSAAATAANKDERPPKLMKTNENGDKSLEKGDEGSFFDCNICLDLASEPVVTCCGHLFCWPCIYRWLFVHSHAKECPICKGEVTIKKITPIYSRANCKHITKVVDQNSSAKIPSRPLANRIESWRQSFQRNTINIPMFEMIRSLDNNRFHLTRDPISNNPQEIPSTLLLNRIFTSRGIRRARDTVPATSPDAMLDLPNWDVNIPNLTSAESFVESYFRDRPDERNQEELPLIDRHSMSSVTDIIWSEIPTTGTGSRRRCESSTSRVLDVEIRILEGDCIEV